MRHRAAASVASAADAHGAEDALVAGAAAEVARQPLPDLVVGGVGVALEQRRGRHDEPRRAEPALQPVLGLERGLHRAELAVGGEALDGGDLGAVGLHGEDEARARPPGRRG